MFHPPANASHAAVAYRTTALDARRQDRAGGPGRFFKIYIFDDCQIIEKNNIFPSSIYFPEPYIFSGARLEFAFCLD